MFKGQPPAKEQTRFEAREAPTGTEFVRIAVEAKVAQWVIFELPEI